MADNCVPILGRLGTVGIFPLDSCFRPIYGAGQGYMDPCFAAFNSSDNMDEGESFTRRCANGEILYQDEGTASLTSVTVELDLNAEPDTDFAVSVGLVEPIMNGASTIGWTRCTNASSNLLIALWQEVLGMGACEGADSSGWRLHLFVLRNARLTMEGGLGAEDSFMRIVGNTVPEADLGKGPIEFLAGSGTTTVWPTTNLVVCHHTVLTNGVAAPPDSCGTITTVAPA